MISQATVAGRLSGTPPSVVNAFIYANAGSRPGTELFRQSGIPATQQPNYEVPLAGVPTLGPGTYWISIQEAGGTFMTPSWAWATELVQTGNQAVFKAPNGGWGSTCLDWMPIKTCFPSGTGVDVAWSVSGVSTSHPFSLGKLRRLKNGTARLPVTIPGPGIVHLGDKRVADAFGLASRQAPTTFVLRIRARGKARRALNMRGAVTVKPKVQYIAIGADGFKQRVTVKLRKG